MSALHPASLPEHLSPSLPTTLPPGLDAVSEEVTPPAMPMSAVPVLAPPVANRLALGLQAKEDLGQAVGKTSYHRGHTVGVNADFITKSQKSTGRDPGQFVYRNPLKHEQFENKGFEPINLVKSLNGHPPQNGQTKKAAQDLCLNHLAELRSEARTHALKELNDNKGSFFRHSNAAVVFAAEGKAESARLVGGSPEFDAFVIGLLKKDRPSLVSAYETAGGSRRDDLRLPDLPYPTRADLVTHYNRLDQAGRREFLNFALIGHAKREVPELGAVYMLKGDYAEADLSRLGKFVNWITGGKSAGEVRISAQLAEGKFSFPLKAWAYRTFGGSTKRDANAGVIKEAMASDMARIFGKDRVRGTGLSNYATQEATVVKAQWSDGTPKLILGVKLLGREQALDEVGGDLPRSAAYKDLEGKIVDGRMVNEYFDNDDKPLPDSIAINKESGLPALPKGLERGADGRPLTPLYREAPPNESVRNLASMVIKTGIALRDRDALGGTGANKGSVGTIAGVIDPGHAWETRGLKVNSDGSIVQPGTENGGKADYQKKMKNFSIGDSAPLSEKMRAVRDLQLGRESGEPVRLFDEYIERFPEFIDEIYQSKQVHDEAISDLVDGVFRERLQVFDYDLNQTQIDQVFNFIDNLEKITSNSDWRSESGLVELYRPRITQDADGNFQRVAWAVAQEQDGTLVFSADLGANKEGANKDAMQRLKAFADGQAGQMPPYEVSGQRKINFRVAPADLGTVNAVVSDLAVYRAVRNRLEQ